MATTKAAEIWEVVGGADRGGILVREGCNLSSSVVPQRLATGAEVRVLEECDGRIRYELAMGSGPRSGWVSASLNGRALLRALPSRAKEEGPAPPLPVQQPRTSTTSAALHPSVGCSSLRIPEGLALYLQRFGKDSSDGFHFDFTTQQWCSNSGQQKAAVQEAPSPAPAPTAHPVQRYRRGPGGTASVAGRRGQHQGSQRKQSQRALQAAPPATSLSPHIDGLWIHAGDEAARLEGMLARKAAAGAVEDSDGEEVSLCDVCRLPVRGSMTDGGKEGPVHGECMAELVLLKLKMEDDVRRAEQAAMKLDQRLKYGIGWDAARMPTWSAATAQRGAAAGFPRGPVCVVLEEGEGHSYTARLAATMEPAAMVNLEYLLVALQVHRSTGKGPVFSLDPVAPKGEADTDPAPRTQRLRYSPAWLAGTRAGEVLFQADYYLKELTMGEYEQPVIGMRSCLDLSADGHSQEWNGREWFIIRKADVLLSEDNVLMPYVKMGVEAREQAMKDGRMQDAKVSRPDHPLVKYAEVFTRHFDLIAERKSVIFHLRELARAAVLAKFLLDADAALDATWAPVVSEGVAVDAVEIPQLWNTWAFKKVRVKYGQVEKEDVQTGAGMRGLYGGAELFYGQPAPKSPYQTVEVAAPTEALAQPGAPVGRAMVARRRAMSYRRRRGGPSLLSAARLPAMVMPAPVPGLLAPRGVDLNVDDFDSLEARFVDRCVQAPRRSEPIAAAFWASISMDAGSTHGLFQCEEDKKLLLSIFDPCLSDRREERELFVPPDPTPSYVEKLRVHVEEERKIMEQRRELFSSASFSMDRPGPLFPSSWRSLFEIERQDSDERPRAATGALEPCPEPSREALREAHLVFERSTEDGARFRIYHAGSTEVRSIQEYGREEAICAAFSVRRSGPLALEPAAAVVQREVHDRIKKVT